MYKTADPSRRLLLGTVASMFSNTSISEEIISADADLVCLGRHLDFLTAQVDCASEHGLDIAWEIVDQIDRVEAEIIAMEATTIGGLRVKARAACWALLGDLDPSNQSTIDTRMALSIVRDLIRLYDCNLEHPGTLRKLVAETDERLWLKCKMTLLIADRSNLP